MDTRIVAAIAAVATSVALQLIVSNRRGAEAEVRVDLKNTQPSSWGFVAMEYCWGILNRTYVIFVTDKMICGAKVRGVLPTPLAPTERWQDPYFYPRPSLLKRLSGINLESKVFLSLNSANFQLDGNEIERIDLVTKPKWGMGSVPYSGRICLRTRNDRSKELILLGTQNGVDIKVKLEGKETRAG